MLLFFAGDLMDFEIAYSSNWICAGKFYFCSVLIMSQIP